MPIPLAHSKPTYRLSPTKTPCPCMVRHTCTTRHNFLFFPYLSLLPLYVLLPLAVFLPACAPCYCPHVPSPFFCMPKQQPLTLWSFTPYTSSPPALPRPMSHQPPYPLFAAARHFNDLFTSGNKAIPSQKSWLIDHAKRDPSRIIKRILS